MDCTFQLLITEMTETIDCKDHYLITKYPSVDDAENI
jgi:hypothetical protein